MKAWSTVGSTGRLALNWNANSAWDPLLEMPVQCWRFAGTLTQIYLNDNNIRVLPQNIAIMHALKELHLERNGLSCLPYVMCQMTNLQVLHLTDNAEMRPRTRRTKSQTPDSNPKPLVLNPSPSLRPKP